MNPDYELDWRKLDCEERWGFRGAKYTGVNNLPALLLALLIGTLFYAGLLVVRLFYDGAPVEMFFPGGAAHRSVIPIFTVLLTAWALAILGIKWRKLAVQRRALTLALVPDHADFVLTPQSANAILRQIGARVGGHREFLLLNRMERALANLRNLGRVADVSAGLAAQSENDEKYLEGSYTLVRGFIWAIPVLGFIGTVLGLAQAVGGFGAVIAAGADLTRLKATLGGVTGGLAVAFETTLIALVAALIVQLLLTVLMKNEQDFLDECDDYCHRHIIARLRLIDIRDDLDDRL